MDEAARDAVAPPGTEASAPSERRRRLGGRGRGLPSGEGKRRGSPEAPQEFLNPDATFEAGCPGTATKL